MSIATTHPLSKIFGDGNTPYAAIRTVELNEADAVAFDSFVKNGDGPSALNYIWSRFHLTGMEAQSLWDGIRAKVEAFNKKERP